LRREANAGSVDDELRLIAGYARQLALLFPGHLG